MSSSTTIQTVSSEDTSDKEICKFCRRQFAKYTCPSCNVPYCSLTCFRSELHDDCSESFYKKEIEASIHGERSKNAEEQAKMLELLKRFEQHRAADAEYLEGGAENDHDTELAQRLSSVDLNTTSADTLWSILTPQEKEKFMKVLHNPSSELAQQLLASEALEDEIWDPWWEIPSFVGNNTKTLASRGRHSDPPSIMHVPSAMLKPVPNRPFLVYNLCSICISYAYIIRHFGVSSLSRISLEDSNYNEAHGLVTQLMPFLIDRKATIVYPNVSSLITDLWSRFDQESTLPDLFSLLLRDASRLMRPLIITQAPTTSSPESEDLSSHPHKLPVLVLSDLCQLFEVGVEARRIPKNLKHVVHKLAFYASHVLTMPTSLLRAVVSELMEKALELESETKEHKADKTDVERRAVCNKPRTLIQVL